MTHKTTLLVLYNTFYNTSRCCVFFSVHQYINRGEADDIAELVVLRDRVLDQLQRFTVSVLERVRLEKLLSLLFVLLHV